MASPAIVNGETGDGAFEEPHRPHIIDDGVAEAEASDHIDLTARMTTRPTGTTSRQPRLTKERLAIGNTACPDGSGWIS